MRTGAEIAVHTPAIVENQVRIPPPCQILLTLDSTPLPAALILKITTLQKSHIEPRTRRQRVLRSHRKRAPSDTQSNIAVTSMLNMKEHGWNR